MDQAKGYCIKGIPLKCDHCGNETFTLEHFAAPFPPIANPLDLLDIGKQHRSVDSLACSNCGCIHSFLQGFVTERSPVSESTVCPQCGGELPAGEKQCPSCGWSYESPPRKP